MSSTGTRVVPTLTEVLDEQRLAKAPSQSVSEGWHDSRPGDETFVPISLDWGDEALAGETAEVMAEEGGVMTPWQVVRPRSAEATQGEAPFIDLSIDVAPVSPPALHQQVLEVYAPLPAISAASVDALGVPEAVAGLACAEAVSDPMPSPSFELAGPPAAAPAVPAAAATALLVQPDGLSSPVLDPGTSAVRQGVAHVPGISEERLQLILQQALDRLLRDELPSALVETLIRLSPQLSESLIESLKPSLHLHVMEALNAEPSPAPEGRSTN